jgi:hypothetical protein
MGGELSIIRDAYAVSLPAVVKRRSSFVHLPVVGGSSSWLSTMYQTTRRLVEKTQI